jgi:hypothetical protein
MIEDKAGSSGVTFELWDRALPDIAPEVIGLWSVVPRGSDGTTASVPTPAEGFDAPVWRANYTDPGRAEASLRMGEARLTVSRKELGSVPERLNRLIETQSAALDFGVRLSEEILAEPEAEFLALMRLPQRTLALALGSLETLFRTVLLAAQLAVKISVLLSTPGGVILTLPAVWRFIHRVLAESNEFRHAGLDPESRAG